MEMEDVEGGVHFKFKTSRVKKNRTLPKPSPDAFCFTEKKRATGLSLVYYDTPNTPVKRSQSGMKHTFLERSEQDIAKRFGNLVQISKTKTSTIYQAISLATSSPVVLKHLNDNLLKTNEAQQNALLEYKIASKLKYHPNIVKYESVIYHGSYIFFEMELCELGSLEAYCRNKSLRTGGTENEYFWSFALDILSGLAYLHTKGYVHGDIKPGNIFLSGHPQSVYPVAKLGDFGLSRKIGIGVHFVSGKKNYKKGDGQYLAPELLSKSHAVSDKSDVYSLGITFFQLASDLRASDEMWEEILKLDGNIEARKNGFSEELSSILCKMLQHNPSARPEVVSILLENDKFRKVAEMSGKAFEVYRSYPEDNFEIEDMDGGSDEVRSDSEELMIEKQNIELRRKQTDSVRKKLF
eukprot:TRINITY_DN14351_c0_g1_i1.p1 TRINITY_DN14351_c0_g1~~TRINITY_DN14351_c0_g1_i1.p1  ORF type:complete len:409 (-),score=60.70 TRINITY_DN14351_c0_g1_i1:51-1277(-)